MIRAALGFIPANLPRDEWVRILMALHSELGPDGVDLAREWSAGSETFKERAFRATWRSLKAGGGVTIGTLMHLAKENGFKPGADTPARPATDPAATAARAQRDQADQSAAKRRQEAAAGKAAAMWEAAAQEGASAYLVRKGVQAHGVRFEGDGTVLVPLRDVAGALWNVQRIAPAPLPDGTDKRYLAGGRKSGLLHWIGDAADAGLLLLAEGYATGATLHEVTGRPVAVAFDCGNLVHVSKILREKYSSARLLVCGDDDAATEASTGVNPGREKATAAAKAARGRVVFPAGLPAGASDFNDLAMAQGTDAVKLAIDGAIAVWDAERAAANASEFDRFKVDETGVWFHGVDPDGKPRHAEWICSPLAVTALTRDQDGHGWGYLLEFADPLGQPKQWAMPARMLSGDGGEYRAALLNMGLRIAPTASGRARLTLFIQTRVPGAFAQCTDRIGWHGHAFVLPRETIGDEGERIVFQSESAMENTFRQRGDVATWRDRIGRLCAGNSRLVFAASCAFAGPMLRPAGMESGGFHLRGDSSSGKTTALRVAASVFGGANYLQRWRTTDNALEAIAAQHSDVLLILDELAQVDPRTAGECAYMLANEQSKARATRSGMPRARLAWRLLFLSAGELGLADHMAEGQKRARPGQEVRMADVPVDAGAGMGAFENLHGIEGGSLFARQLTREAGAVFGAPGYAFIEWASERAETLPRRLREAVAALVRDLVPEGASGQVERVGARFALVGAAGELASEAGMTGWDAGEAARAARTCFAAWLASRGGHGNGEVTAIVRQVRNFFELHGEGRFTWWHRAADDHATKTLHRAGYRRLVNEDGEPIKTNSEHGVQFGDRMPAGRGEETSAEFFVLPEVFRREICAGLDHATVCKVLLERGHLVPGPNGRPDRRDRLPGMGNTTCYRIRNSIFGDDA